MIRMIQKASIMLMVLIITGHNAVAQNLKFGHINRDELIMSMPEFDSIQISLEKLRKELINYLELMSAELNNKYDAYMMENKNLSEVVKQTREQELTEMNQRIQEFQATAQSHFLEKQAEFFQPLFLKVDKAIKDVGKENGFFYIFNTSQGDPVYFDESKSYDITDLVKAKFKID
jgi:outer membrane protein